MDIAITFISGFILLTALSFESCLKKIKYYKKVYEDKIINEHNIFNSFIREYIFITIFFIVFLTIVLFCIYSIDNKLKQLFLCIATQIIGMVLLVLLHENCELRLKQKLEKL